MPFDDITDVSGIQVGHDTNLEAMTGCTVVLCAGQPAVGGVDVRGGGPGTRETDLLNPTCNVNEVHAVLLTGGSAFGLDAATGVMRALERMGIGYQTPIARIPIVPAAVLFDLGIGRADVRPDAASGERAVAAAGIGPIAQGSVGAGTGATIAKLQGPASGRKSGIGSASAALPDGAIVGAIVAVNAVGDVSESGWSLENLPPWPAPPPSPMTNTTIGVIATSARLTKAQATKVAQMAHDGLARVIRPLHTPFDGDAIFALSLAAPDAPPADSIQLAMIGAAAADVISRAVIKGVRAAQG
jgi:L-aminopeptidase/D-esterase-like protein